MKRSINQNYNSGNLRASSSNVDNFRNQGLKRISNNLIPDNYNYRNHNFISVKYDKNSKKNNYISNHNQSINKQNINIDNMLNGLKQEIREMSKSIEKTDNEIQKFIDNNYENNHNKYYNDSSSLPRDRNINLSNGKRNELVNSYINININKTDEVDDNSFRYRNYKNNNNSNSNYTTNISNSNNYKEYNKAAYEYKRKNNTNNISVGVGKNDNYNINKIKELNIRNDSLERTNTTLKHQLNETNKTITKLVNTINMLKNDNQRLNDNNKENKNKIDSIINELNDLNINKSSILSELKIKEELILKYDNKINILEEEINQLKMKNDINEDKHINNIDRENLNNGMIPDMDKDNNNLIALNENILNLNEIKNEKIKLYKNSNNNILLNEDKKNIKLNNYLMKKDSNKSNKQYNNEYNFLIEENNELKEQLKLMNNENAKLINVINSIDIKFKELEDNNNALKQQISINEKNII